MSSSQSSPKNSTPEEEPLDTLTNPVRDKQVDKRKAPEKESFDLEMTDEFTSLQSPLKKPRIQVSSSFTPSKAPDMSPLCPDDESPLKFLSQGDIPILTTFVSAVVSEENQSIMDESSNINEVNTTVKIEESVTEENFIQPLPVNTVEGVVSVKVCKGNESDSDSDGFFSKIRKNEEQQLRLKEERSEEKYSALNPTAQLDPTVIPVVVKRESGSSSDSSRKKDRIKGESSRKGRKSGKDSHYKRSKTDSNNKNSSYSSGLENSSQSPHAVEFTMQLFDERSNTVIYDTRGGRVKSDMVTMMAFFKNHKIDISSHSLTGYSADVSSQESSITFDFLTTPQRPRITSLGSSIPRPSDASTLNRPSIVGDNNGQATTKSAKQQIRPPRQRGDLEPILSSTRITEYKLPKTGASSSGGSANKGKLNFTVESNNKSKTPITNGGDHSTVKSTGKSEGGKGRGRRTQAEGTNANKTPIKPAPPEVSKLKGDDMSMTETKEDTLLEGKGSILMFSGATDEPKVIPSTLLSQSQDTSSTNDTSASEVDAEVIKRIKREPVDDVQTPRSKVARGLGAAKGLVEKFDEPNFVKSATLWGAIQVDEPVFARWRDKSYYSGRIIKKGMNDTWYIHFEDDMEDVASETHILPIKILGIGSRGVYCPSDCFKPEEVIIVGQRFTDPVEKVEYAVISDVDGRQINCFRRNLIIKQADAKELRKLYQIPNSCVFKTADLNLDNIVTGPRRRVGAIAPAPSDQIRKLIADAFDASSADEHLLTPWTPTPKKTIDQTGRRESGASGTESSASTASDDTRKSVDKKTVATTPIINEKPGTSKTLSDAVLSDLSAKDTPKSVAKDSSKKGKNEKPLFHGIQFFLTASGGGDPSSSGTSGTAQLVTYDKDEYRETIENKGGSVVNSVSRENNKGKTQIFLISDGHARTVKYIYCVAAGIPCISSLWIGECLKQNTIVDWKPFELGSGWSLEEGAVIPAHQKKPLKDIRIFVTAESEELYNYWKPVLTAAQANLLKPLKSRKRPSVPPETEVLVTDATCTPEILESAQEKGIPVVKPEWLVQTIITGQKAEYTGHEKYQVGMSDAEMCEDEGEEEQDENDA